MYLGIFSIALWRHKRRLMLNGKRQKSLDLLFPVVQCIGPRYRRSRSIRCWDFGKRPERKSLLALESISLPFNFLCCGLHKCLPNVFQQRGVVIHKPPFPTLVGRFDRLSCGRKAESVLVIIPGKHRCAWTGTFPCTAPAWTIDNLRRVACNV